MNTKNKTGFLKKIKTVALASALMGTSAFAGDGALSFTTVPEFVNSIFQNQYFSVAFHFAAFGGGIYSLVMGSGLFTKERSFKSIFTGLFAIAIGLSYSNIADFVKGIVDSSLAVS